MAHKVGALILTVLVCQVRLQAIEFISPGQYSYCPSSFLPVAASQPELPLENPVNLPYSQSTQTIIYQHQGIPLQTPAVDIEPSGPILQSLPPSFTFLPPQSVPSQPCSSVNLQPPAEVQLPPSSISLPFPPSYTFLPPQPVSFQPNVLPPAVESTPQPTSVNLVSQIPSPNQLTYLSSPIPFQPPSALCSTVEGPPSSTSVNLVSQNQFTYLPAPISFQPQFNTPVEISPSPSVEVIASTSLPIPSPPPYTFIPFLTEPQPPSSVTLFSPPQISAPINLPKSPVPLPAPTFEVPSPPILLPQPILQPISAPLPLVLPSIPPPVTVQPPAIPNTPLVATNVIKNSLSNSLANLLQLYLATRLTGCQKNGGIQSPFLNDIGPLYNAIGNIGTTNLYAPLIQYPCENCYDVRSIVNPVSYGLAEIPSLDLVPNIYAVTNYPVNFGVADNIGPVIAYY